MKKGVVLVLLLISLFCLVFFVQGKQELQESILAELDRIPGAKVNLDVFQQFPTDRQLRILRDIKLFQGHYKRE
ncbi:hypothetical protein ABK040_003699 [Willaertia magna]